MLTTFIVVGLLLGLLVASLALSAWLLWVGARWARIPDVGFKRALVAALLATGIGLFCQGVVLAIHAEDRYPLVVPGLSLAGLVGTWKVVQRAFRTSLGRAVRAWLPTLLMIPAGLLLVWLVVHPFLLEAYLVPTNGMAPTIMGDHLLTRCPRCWGSLIVPAMEQVSPQGEKLGICARCLQTSNVDLPNGEPLAGDRFFVLKTLVPRRWDIVVFRVPSDPSTVYVERLVGMPGEEVAIRDGDVWIDGRVAEKPQELATLQYSARLEVLSGANEQQTVWGPVRLGVGEYFMLGDFSRRSFDARYWTVGARGHPTYAVPDSFMVGVVTHIYWPRSRWRIFR